MTGGKSGQPAHAPAFADLLDLMPCAAFEAEVRAEEGLAAVTYMNRMATQMYGVELEQARGRPVRDVAGVTLAPSEWDRVYAALLRGGGYHELETTQVGQDGREMTVRARMRARMVAGAWRIIGTVEDITDEHRLRLRLDELMTLIDVAEDAITGLDGQFRIALWNTGAEKTFGYTREEVLGRVADEVLSIEYPTGLEELATSLSETDRWEGDLVQICKDGRAVRVATRVIALRDGNGDISSVFAIARDITDRLALEAERERARLSERLMRAERLESLGQLAGGIAHDFNNLLGVMAGYATLIAGAAEDLAGKIDEATFKTLVGDSAQIAEAVGRASALTHQLLAFARQESVRAEPLSLNAVVAQLQDMLRRTLGQHITLETRLEPRLRTMIADEGQLGQVLVNLAVNSRDAMPDGGHLVIETSNIELKHEHESDLPDGPGVRLRVSDTGCGMPPEVLDRAFEPFFTTKADMSGTGLGLATVYGIIIQAGGRASLYSEPGRGTTFSASFPAVDAPVAPSLPRPPPAPARGDDDEGTRTVLLVDDQPALRAVTARTLEQAGYAVLTAANGGEALELADATDRIDVLVTDVVMPEMLGQQLADLLRERRPDLRVIFISGFARPALEHGGRPLDGPLLQKPFSAAELLAMVADTLRQV